MNDIAVYAPAYCILENPINQRAKKEKRISIQLIVYVEGFLWGEPALILTLYLILESYSLQKRKYKPYSISF